MSNYIETVELDISLGGLSGTMQFQQGLNLLSGENGTFKTKILQQIGRGHGVTFHHENAELSPARLQAISPKRNAERQTVEHIYNTLRRQDVKLASLLTVKNMNDSTFETYPSIGELFLTVYEDRCRDGGNRIEKMNEVAQDFNAVVKSIFEHYELQARWDEAIGAPDVTLLKQGDITVPLEGLSTGEQEILSLVAYIHSSRDSFEIFLIDEPEVHLNWHLEERLFAFLAAFCVDYEKQLIVVTHSRVVFTQKFLPLTTFMFWRDGEAKWGSDLTAEQRRRLAGDAIEILKLGTFAKTVFFVEDDSLAEVVEAVAEVLGADVFVSACGNKANVRSLYKMAKLEDWPDSYYFVEDGDNEGSPYDDPRFIHLDKYCIESYLIDPSILSAISGKSVEEIRNHIYDSVLENRDRILQKNKFFDFLIDGLKVEDLTDERLSKLDVSHIFDSLIAKIGLLRKDFLKEYVRACKDKEILDAILPGELVLGVGATVLVGTEGEV